MIFVNLILYFIENQLLIFGCKDSFFLSKNKTQKINFLEKKQIS